MVDSYNVHTLSLLLTASLCLNNVKASLLQIEHLTRPNSPVRFIALGDWGRRGRYNQSAVAQTMGKIGSKLGTYFIISSGDNFYPDGLTGVNDPAFAYSFSRIYTAKSLQKPWYSGKGIMELKVSENFLNNAVLGNHDYHGNTFAQLDPYLKRLDRRWNCHRSYVVRAGNGLVHFFFIDTSPFVNKYFNRMPKKKEKLNWEGVLPRNKYISTLKKDLNTALKESRKIVVGHHPIRSIGYRGDTTELKQHILPILEANKVAMYINGHDHCLQRINNTGLPIESLTSGRGSKAWKNRTNYARYKKNLKFYYDGQGSMSVQLTRRKAYVDYYNIYAKNLHSFKLLMK